MYGIALPKVRRGGWTPAAFFFLDTSVGKLLNAVRFSPPGRVADAPWRAPLCTPLERGWVELWDIEIARFSVASCGASAVLPGFKLAQAGSRSDAQGLSMRRGSPLSRG
jgi:hypothetical protein